MQNSSNTTYIKDNLIVIVATFFVILSGYVFHILTAKNLGPDEYGLIVSLLAIIYLVDIFLHASQTIITTKIAEARSKNEETTTLIGQIMLKNIRYGLIALTIFLLLVPPLSIFFNTDDYLATSMLGILVFSSFLIPVVRGFFQGMQQFWKLALTYFLEGAVKIAILLLLLSFGGRAASAITSISLSYLVPFVMALPILPVIRKPIKTQLDYNIINHTTLLLMSLALFYSLDLALVKHFFTPTEAGLYSAASLYGKLIIFSAIPISMVLLPKGVEAHTRKNNPSILLKKSLISLSVICLPLLALYFAIPRQIIALSLGQSYLNAAPFMIHYGIISFLIALAYVESFYLMSLKKERKLWIPVTLIWLIEPTAISIIHNSIYSVLAIMMISSAILAAFLSIHILRLKAAKPI